jgi:hypothetical protein
LRSELQYIRIKSFEKDKNSNTTVIRMDVVKTEVKRTHGHELWTKERICPGKGRSFFSSNKEPKIRLVSSTALCYHENIMNF